jgi:LmbE family N-acetylglucosaminyl deacetylase
MPRRHQRALAVAARTGRLGCIVVDDGDLVIWDTSEKGAGSPRRAAAKLRAWIAEYNPDVLVTENPDAAGRKHGQQVEILQTFLALGQELPLINLVVRRHRRFRNAYEEAADLASQFPDLALMVPKKPPIWGNEPYNLVLFEALVLMREAGLLKPFAKSDAGEA